MERMPINGRSLTGGRLSLGLTIAAVSVSKPREKRGFVFFGCRSFLAVPFAVEDLSWMIPVSNFDQIVTA